MPLSSEESQELLLQVDQAIEELQLTELRDALAARRRNDDSHLERPKTEEFVLVLQTLIGELALRGGITLAADMERLSELTRGEFDPARRGFVLHLTPTEADAFGSPAELPLRTDEVLKEAVRLLRSALADVHSSEPGAVDPES